MSLSDIIIWEKPTSRRRRRMLTAASRLGPTARRLGGKCDFCLSARDILKGVSGLFKPVMGLVNKLLDPLLAPLKKVLDIKINFPAVPPVLDVPAPFTNPLQVIKNLVITLPDPLPDQFPTITSMQKLLDETVNVMLRQYLKL